MVFGPGDDQYILQRVNPKVFSEPEKLMEAYRLGTLFVIGLMTPAAGFLFANPEVPQIISSEYVIADSLLVLLCFAPLVDPFSRLGGEVLKTFHKDAVWIVSVGLTLASFIGFGLFFTTRYGPIGMAWANFIQLGMLPMAWSIYRIAPGPFKRLVRDLALLYLVPLVPFLAIKLVLPDLLWPRLGLSVIAALISSSDRVANTRGLAPDRCPASLIRLAASSAFSRESM